MSDDWADPNRPPPDDPGDATPPDYRPPPGYGPPQGAPPPTYGPPQGAPPPTYGPPPGYGPPPTWATPTYAANADPFGAPFGPPPTGPMPPRRARTAVIVSATIALVVILGIAAIVLDSHRNKNSSAGSANPAGGVASSSPAPSASSGASTPPAPSSANPNPPSAPGIPNGSNAPSSPGSTGGTTTGPYDSYLLSPGEVAATGMDLIDGGRGIDAADPTLDWCGRTYPSDSLRTARVQVEYEGSNDFVSNEFVRYSNGGTSTAYAEIQAAVQSCQPSFVESGAETNQIQVAAHLSTLVSDQVTVSAFEQGEIPLWTAVVYQFDGNYFSGVYVSGASRAEVLHAAQLLGAKAATHLRQAVAGTHGSGGGVVGSPPPDSSAQAGGGAQT